MEEEKEVTSSEKTENATVKPKGKFDKTQVITLLLTILFAALAAVLIIFQMGNKKDDKKEVKVVNGLFAKTTYYYEKVDSDKEGPMPAYYVFDKDGKYVSISVSPNANGEAGSYKIDGDEITVSRQYYFNVKEGKLSVSDPTSTSVGHVNLGSYKDGEIIIYGHKLEQVEKSKYEKDIDTAYTYNDIDKAFKSQPAEEPTKPTEEDPEEKNEEEAIPSSPSKCENITKGDYYPQKCTIGKYTYTLKVVKEDEENFQTTIGIYNDKDVKLAEYSEYPDGSDDIAFNEDGSVMVEGTIRQDDSYNHLNVYTYKMYSYEGKELTVKTKKEVVKLMDNYVAYVDNGYLKLADYKGNVVKGYEFKIDNSKHNLHPMLSGWFTEKGKNGIYFVIEDTSIEFGEDGAGLEYYYIPTTGEVGTIKTEGVGGYAKPVLYLYPEKETKVKVSFEKPELLTTTYPKFKNAWEVIAKSNGDLKDKDGKYYYGLYWEEEGSTNVDFKEGFYVTKDNAIKFLEEKLSYIGLTERESNEFIMYWLPILEKNNKSVVYFELTEERQAFNKLIIKPTPDSMLRLAIHVKKVDKKPANLVEQKLTKFERKGFAAVEWGGVVHN